MRPERHYAGYDTDDGYVANAKKRIDNERSRLNQLRESENEPPRVVLSIGPAPAPIEEDFQARAVREGRAARDIAREALETCGFRDVNANVSLPEGIEINFVAQDDAGRQWFFDVSGGFTSNRPGLRRTDTLWKALGKAAVLKAAYPSARLVLLTTDAPVPNSAGDAALAVVRGPKKAIRDVIVLSSSEDLQRLRRYARG